MRYKSGDMYEGEWHKGKKDGEGVFTQANGEQIFGIWKEGKYIRSS